MIDHGIYNDLIERSEILREFVRSGKEQHEHESNDERRESISISVPELVTNSVEIDEEKKKLIEKEKIETGSVSSCDKFLFFIEVISY